MIGDTVWSMSRFEELTIAPRSSRNSIVFDRRKTVAANPGSQIRAIHEPHAGQSAISTGSFPAIDRLWLESSRIEGRINHWALRAYAVAKLTA